MSAREIIAKWIWGYADREGRVDNILSDLSAAGYRLVAPGELDAETLERAAKAVEAMRWYRHTSPDHVEANRPKDYATAIRSLTPGSMEGRE